MQSELRFFSAATLAEVSGAETTAGQFKADVNQSWEFVLAG